MRLMLEYEPNRHAISVYGGAREGIMIQNDT